MQKPFYHKDQHKKDQHKDEEYPGNGKVLGFFKSGSEDTSAQRDAFLWKAFLSGSKEAFSDIFLRHNPRLVTVGIKLGFSSRIVEDCIQDLFLNLWIKRQNLSEVKSVKYYLIVSLRRSLLQYREKENKILKLLTNIKHDYPVSELPELWNDQLIEHKTESVLKCLDLLPKRQASALKLRYLEQKTYPEIASIMAVDIDSVRKFVYKAIKSLRSNLHN